MLRQRTTQNKTPGAFHRGTESGERSRLGRDDAGPRIQHVPEEVSLGGYADRGLTLAALYETGVFDRLRMEVRVRMVLDLTESLALMHDNARLMEANPHLGVAPATVVIGLDGVARLDLRAAKKQRKNLGAEYTAPEVSAGQPNVDHRADIFSWGVVVWEALCGRRSRRSPAAGVGAKRRRRRALETIGQRPVPLAIGPRPIRAALPGDLPDFAPSSGSRSSTHANALALPALPEDARWAAPLALLAQAAMSREPARRPPSCQSLLLQMQAFRGVELASHREIAEVVQGITSVASLLMPEPGPPKAQERCQVPEGARGRPAPQPCASAMLEVCAAPAPPPASQARPVRPGALVAMPEAPVALAAGAPASPAAVSSTAVSPAAVSSATAAQLQGSAPRMAKSWRRLTAGHPPAVWLAVGMLWLATLGLLVGYFARGIWLR